MVGAALRACPLSGIQIKGLKHMTTDRARLAGWIPAVYLDQRASVPLSFVLQLSEELAPSHISDRLGKCRVLHHMLDRQALDADHLVLADQTCREFVLIVPASIAYSGVDLGDLPPSLFPIATALLLFCMPFLGTRQLLCITCEVFGIVYFLALRGDHHRNQPQIDADPLRQDGEWRDLLFY